MNMSTYLYKYDYEQVYILNKSNYLGFYFILNCGTLLCVSLRSKTPLNIFFLRAYSIFSEYDKIFIKNNTYIIKY